MTIELKENERIDELQRNGYQIIQNKDKFCFGMDAVLLSTFTHVKKGEKVLDLGTGTGIIPILLEAKTEAIHITGLEIQEEMAEMAKIRKSTISKKLGVPIEKIRTVTHEDCHVFYAYFGSHIRGKALTLTSEGIGDYSNGTVWEFTESERKELARTGENHLGHIYQYVTLILGMKPAQHEYKVMGLAPYANEKELQKSYKVFENILKVEGLNIVFDKRPKDLYFHFLVALEGHRFDGIAGAVQRFLEDILCKWVKNSR